MDGVADEHAVAASTGTGNMRDNETNNRHSHNTAPTMAGMQQALTPIEPTPVVGSHQHQHQQQHQQQQQQPPSHLNTSPANACAGNAPTHTGAAAAAAATPGLAVSALTTSTNLAQYPLTALAHQGVQVQSVIQAANQSSVIQTAIGTNTASVGNLHKNSVLFVGKPSNCTVIHTTGGGGGALQVPHSFQCQVKPEPQAPQLDTNSEDSLSDEDSSQRRNELSRRPSYNKIFTEISGPDMSAAAAGTALQMSESVGLSNFIGSGANNAGTLLHMSQENATAFFLPNRIANSANNSVIAEDQTRKREIRLQKNREAARECRRKKKEYIKCLENRVAVLENQNKALIEELKSLKELYCQTKNE